MCEPQIRYLRPAIAQQETNNLLNLNSLLTTKEGWLVCCRSVFLILHYPGGIDDESSSPPLGPRHDMNVLEEGRLF